MIKKNLIGLSTLLLVLLLGLFSNSYAVTTDFMEDYMEFVNQEVPTTRGGYMVAKFSSQLWQLFKEKYATTCESYDNFLFIFPQNLTQGFRVLLWNDNENTGYFDKEYNGQQIGVTETLSVLDIYVPYNANTINNLTDSTRDLPWLPAYASMNIAYYGFYIGDKKVYTNNNLNVVSTKNWVYSNNFSTDKFEFSPTTSNFQVCSINGLVQPSEVYVYERTTQNYLTLGYLEKFSNLDNISITKYRYNRFNGWVEVSDWATDDFSGYNVQDDVLTYTIDVSRINADTLVLFNFTPNNIQDFANQTFALYVKSPYTVISNGVIYPAQTFSGDYYNNYNDDSNTDKIVDNNKSDSDKIIDTLTDDSQVDGMLSELVSGDAEDIAKKFGFTLFNRYYYDFIHDTIEDIVEVLEQDGDVYFDYSMHGEAPTRIYASQFTTPDGPLKTFLSMFLIACTVFAFYKYIADIIELISTGNILEALQEFKIDRNIFKM